MSFSRLFERSCFLCSVNRFTNKYACSKEVRDFLFLERRIESNRLQRVLRCVQGFVSRPTIKTMVVFRSTGTVERDIPCDTDVTAQSKKIVAATVSERERERASGVL